MGYSASAYLVYGFKCSKSDLQTVKQVRGCNHPQTGGKFCPECGKPMFVEKTETIDLDYGYENEKNLALYSSDYESYERVVGFVLGYTDSISEVSMPTPEMKKALLDFIQEHNLDYNEMHLAVKLILHHSY
jgi:hypothetical protein